MTDHIDTAKERELLAGLTGFTPGPWYAGQPEHANGWWIVTTDAEHFDCIDGSGDGGFYWSEANLIAAAPELLALAHRLLDALDAERALTQRATDGWSKVQDAQIDALARAEKAEAELMRLEHDISIAENHIAKDAETYTEQHLEIERLRDAIKNAEAERDQALARLAAAYAAADICALTPADAEAALQRVVEATWNDAVEAAAGVAAMHGNPPNTQWANGYAAACRENAADILALKRPEASHE